MTPLGTTEIRFSAIRSLWIFSLAVGILAGSIYVLQQPPSLKAACAGGFGILLGGVAIVWILWRSLQPHPAFLIDIDGVEDRSSIKAFGRLHWDEIDTIVEVKKKQNRFIVFQVRDVTDTLTRYSPLKRGVMKLFAWDGGHPFCISANMLDMRHDELLGMLQEHFEASRAANVDQG